MSPRKSKPKMVPLHTLVLATTLERIDRTALARGLSRAAFLRRLFLGLERIEPEPDVEPRLQQSEGEPT